MSRADVVIIDLYPPWADCWVCGEPTPYKWGLAVNAYAELVANDYEGEWGGVPACQDCYEGHAQGLLTADTMQDWIQRRKLQAIALQHLIVRE